MKFLTILALLTLTACGFTPVYGNKSTSYDLGQVDIQTIPNRSGQIVRNHIIDRIYQNGYPSNPRYQLSVSSINENTVEIGIDRDDEASRAQLRQEAQMTLTDTTTNKTVLKRTVRATTGYNILTGQFTTYVTEQDARKQALNTIADNIITELEIYFSQ